MAVANLADTTATALAALSPYKPPSRHTIRRLLSTTIPAFSIITSLYFSVFLAQFIVFFSSPFRSVTHSTCPTRSSISACSRLPDVRAKFSECCRSNERLHIFFLLVTSRRVVVPPAMGDKEGGKWTDKILPANVFPVVTSPIAVFFLSFQKRSTKLSKNASSMKNTRYGRRTLRSCTTWS